MKPLFYKFLVVGIFAISMGFLEAVVVVYLREIYYPDGFDFPLTMIEPGIFGIELVREVTTLVMLITIGLLVGKSANGKFAWFLYTFGIWDIFYYVGLKLFLDWPESLLTWDILFLIPITWIGPVLAPLICALTMIIFGTMTARIEFKGRRVIVGYLVWIMMLTGAVLIFFSFIRDYARLLYASENFNRGAILSEPGFVDAITTYVPEQFNWILFGIGEFLILISIYLIFRKNRKPLP